MDKFKLAIVNSGLLSEELLSSYVGGLSTPSSPTVDPDNDPDAEDPVLDAPFVLYGLFIATILFGLQKALLLALLAAGAWIYINTSVPHHPDEEVEENETATEVRDLPSDRRAISNLTPSFRPSLLFST